MPTTISVTLTNKQYDAILATNGSPETFITTYVLDYANWCKKRIKDRAKTTSLNTLSALSPSQLTGVVATMPTPITDEE
jgi:hypothetical protein